MASKRVVLHIKVMDCASCVATIEKCLSRMRGVSEVTVSLATGEASLEYDPGSVDIGKIIRTVESAGYKAREFAEERVEEKGVQRELRLFILGLILTPHHVTITPAQEPR